MACDITKGRSKACKEQLGGVANLYLFNFLENPFTIVAGEVTAINPALTVVYRYELTGDGHPLAENMVSDRNTGTTVNTQTLTAILKGLDAETGAEMNLLAYGFPQGVVEDRNGVFHAVAVSEGIDFTIASTTGSAKTDLNGYTLTGVSTEKTLSPKLDDATILSFLALVA